MATIDLLGIVLPQKAAVMLVGEAIIAVLLPLAVFLAIRHRGKYHHWTLLSVFLLDELVLKGLMIQSLMNGSLGDYPYTGTAGLSHLLFSAISTAAGIATIVLGFMFRSKREGNMFMPKEKKKVHRIAGVAFLLSWYVSFLLGLSIFSSFYM
ncbi:MAG TPA: hypothetical protein VGB78_03655 [Thermoplasmata archaeon]